MAVAPEVDSTSTGRLSVCNSGGRNIHFRGEGPWRESHWSVAQLGERGALTAQVGGSNPSCCIV